MNPKASFGKSFHSKLRRIIFLLIRDNSANKLLFTSLLKFESHYPPLRGIVQLTNSDTLCFRNWSFTNKIMAVTVRKQLPPWFLRRSVSNYASFNFYHLKLKQLKFFYFFLATFFFGAAFFFTTFFTTFFFGATFFFTTFFFAVAIRWSLLCQNCLIKNTSNTVLCFNFTLFLLLRQQKL